MAVHQCEITSFDHALVLDHMDVQCRQVQQLFDLEGFTVKKLRGLDPHVLLQPLLVIAHHEEDGLIREDLSDPQQHLLSHCKLLHEGPLPWVFLVAADGVKIHEVSSQKDAVHLLHHTDLQGSCDSFNAVVGHVHIRQPEDLGDHVWEQVRQVFSLI